jgi:CRISPR-associated protein Cmr4
LEMSADQTFLYLYTETLLHAGTGSGLSSIDLPIQRERTTHYPTIAGSSIKGKLRATAQVLNKHRKKNQQAGGNNNSQETEQSGANDQQQEAQQPDTHSRKPETQQPDELEINIAELFGSERENAQAQQARNVTGQTMARPQDHAGALIIGDARLLLFPVRSLYGIFAYTTSYYALYRFMRDAESSLQPPPDWKLPELPERLTTPNALVTSVSDVVPEDTLVLEEFSFEANKDETITGIVTNIANWIADNAFPQTLANNASSQKEENYSYFASKLRRSLVILSDDDFRDFITYSTEVVTRISIDSKTKTATDKGLWTEENLPSDTLLYVPVYATQSRMSSAPQENAPQRKSGADILTSAIKILPPGTYIQLGGNETVGRGIVRTRWAEEPVKENKADGGTVS